LARRRNAQRTLGIRMRSSAAEIARTDMTTASQSGKLTCDPIENLDPARRDDARGPRRHDTVFNSIVTSGPSLKTGLFPAVGISSQPRY
jgi:hypothetical protein